MNNVTLQIIADELGVSKMTVSRAIRNHPDISNVTKERVLKIVAKYSYRPNMLVPALFRKRTYIIGLVIPSIRDSFFPEVTKGVEDEASRRGYNVILCNSDGKQKKEIQLIDVLLGKQVDGLLVAPSQETNDINPYLRLIKEGINLVFIDKYFKGLKANYVVVDDKNGAYKIVEHLIKLGHKKIAHIKGPKFVSTSVDRFEGYKRALKKYGIYLDEEIIIAGGFDEESGYQAMGKLLKIMERFSAVFCVNDPVAIGAYKAIKEANIKIPEDIALTGFADSKEISFLEVPLTTVNQPKYKLGEKAASLLLDQIEKKVKEPKKIVLRTKLIIRKSCGAQ